MSRLIPIDTQLKTTLGTSFTVGKTAGNGGLPRTVFAWLYLSDWGGSSSVNNSLIGFLTGGDPAAQLNGV